MVQALRLNTLSKLTFADSKRFDALVKDVFLGVPFREVEYKDLEAALREACLESNLVVIESQVGGEGVMSVMCATQPYHHTHLYTHPHPHPHTHIHCTPTYTPTLYAYTTHSPPWRWHFGRRAYF